MNTTLLTDPDATLVWQQVSRRVGRYLRSRGAAGPDVDDIVQEVAVRAIVHDVTYLDTNDLTAWCLVVARNLQTDASRRARTTSDLKDLHATPGAQNIATLIEQRAAVSRLLEALKCLPAEDLAVLFADRSAPGTLSKVESTRLAVRRHRIRAQLSKLIAGLLGVAGALGLRRPHAQTVLLTPIAVAAVATLAVIAIAVPPTAVEHQPPPKAYSPSDFTQPLPPILAHERAESAPRAAAARSGGDSPRAQPLPPRVGGSHRIVAVNPDGQHPVYVDRRPAGPKEHLLCLDHVPVLGGSCLG